MTNDFTAYGTAQGRM